MIFLFFNFSIFIPILSILSLFSIFSFFLHAGQFAILETLDCRKKILPGSRIKSSYLSSRKLLPRYEAGRRLLSSHWICARPFLLHSITSLCAAGAQSGLDSYKSSALHYAGICQKKKHLHEAPKDRRLIPEKIQQAFCIRFALKRMQKLIVYTVSCL